MSSGGLGQTDFGSCSDRIGGIALEFYTRNRQYYGPIGNVTPTTDLSGENCRLPAAGCNQTYNLEPKVALSIFEDMLGESGVDIMYGSQVTDVVIVERCTVGGCAKMIDSIVVEVEIPKAEQATTSRSLMKSESKDNPVTRTIPAQSESRKATIRGRVFIDAGYEGDLMAAAGVSFVTGREANTTYNESLNGRSVQDSGNQMEVAVDPYWDDGTTLPFVWNGSVAEPGQGDNRIQAYNFRLCVTLNASNQLPFPKPDNYNSDDWEILRRMHKAGLLGNS